MDCASWRLQLIRTIRIFVLTIRMLTTLVPYILISGCQGARTLRHRAIQKPGVFPRQARNVSLPTVTPGISIVYSTRLSCTITTRGYNSDGNPKAWCSSALSAQCQPADCDVGHLDCVQYKVVPQLQPVVTIRMLTIRPERCAALYILLSPPHPPTINKTLCPSDLLPAPSLLPPPPHSSTQYPNHQFPSKFFFRSSPVTRRSRP